MLDQATDLPGLLKDPSLLESRAYVGGQWIDGDDGTFQVTNPARGDVIADVADLSRAHRMVRAIRAGVVHVNTYGGADLTVPLGGVGQSG